MDGNNEINARLTTIANNLQFSNQLMAKLVGIMSTLFPRSTGTFTMAAASSKVITDANVTTSSFIPPPTPTNAAAATLMAGATSLYVTAGAGSFTVTTANGAAAVGNEQFSYAVFNAL